MAEDPEARRTDQVTSRKPGLRLSGQLCFIVVMLVIWLICSAFQSPVTGSPSPSPIPVPTPIPIPTAPPATPSTINYSSYNIVATIISIIFVIGIVSWIAYPHLSAKSKQRTVQPQVDDAEISESSALLRIESLSKHPVILLLVGGLISGILIPRWMSQWQDRQKELEIKVDLVQRIDDSIVNFVMSIQFAVLGAKGQPQEEYDKSYKTWEAQRSSIKSRLSAYYPETDLANQWQELSDKTTKFYAASGVSNQEAQRIFRNNFEVSKSAIISEKDNLIKRVLRERVSVFQ